MIPTQKFEYVFRVRQTTNNIITHRSLYSAPGKLKMRVVCRFVFKNHPHCVPEVLNGISNSLDTF